MEYPFQPKSTAHLSAGQFWPISLSDGAFACGMVLDVVRDSRREFLAGLIDWQGSEPPRESEVVGRDVVEQGVGHIKMVTEGYGHITGEVPSGTEVPKPLLWVDHLGGADWGLFRGLDLIRKVSGEEAKNYPRRRTWGYNVINLLAAKKQNTQQDLGANALPRVAHD